MQLTNGAIKSSAPPPPLMNQLAAQELEGVDLETFDLSAFVATGKTKDKSTDKSVLSPEVQNFMNESDAPDILLSQSSCDPFLPVETTWTSPDGT